MSAPIAPADEPTHGAVEGTYTKIVDELILDRIDALRVLRADSQEEKGALLEKIAGRGKPEQDIVSELSKVRPLWRPDRFEEAHRMAMRSLEVLDRNGARSPKLPRLGPLTPPAAYVVEQMTRWIVKGHQNTMVTRVRKLYERREANSVWGSPEHHMLRRARIDAAGRAGVQGQPLGPAHLPARRCGALLGGLRPQPVRRVGVQRHGGRHHLRVGLRRGVLRAGLGRAVLGGRGTPAHPPVHRSADEGVVGDHRRLRHPPKDGSYDFAVYAIVLLALAWVLVPMAGWLLFRG